MVQRDDQSRTVTDVAGAAELAAAEARLQATIAGYDAGALAADSRCDGWTRAHVLAHVARNADALANLCHWAVTGEVTPMYESVAARNTAIDAGAGRAPGELLDDVMTSARGLAAALAAFEDACTADPAIGEREVRVGAADGASRPLQAAHVPNLRLLEVEVHHVDLVDGYDPRDWPEPFVDRALPQVWSRLAARLDDLPVVVAETATGPRRLVPWGGPTTVTGPPHDLLAWLLGRADDTQRARLSTRPEGRALPTVPGY